VRLAAWRLTVSDARVFEPWMDCYGS